MLFHGLIRLWLRNSELRSSNSLATTANFISWNDAIVSYSLFLSFPDLQYNLFTEISCARKNKRKAGFRRYWDLIDLTESQAKAVPDKVGDAANTAGKTLKDTNLADSAAKGADKLGKQVKQGGDSALVKVSTVWHVEETVNSLRSNPDWISLRKIPGHTRKALLAIEDHDFYKHGALDITGIARAAFVNLKAGEVQQGGSTLTQQMVKNVFLSSEQTMARKVEEAVLATWVERKYSKDEVLEMYFNTTYFGAGAYGIRDAAKKFFGKDPSQLTLPESAMLAAMPYAPSALNPYENPGGCAKRVRLVLKEMLKYGYIGNTELKEALAKGVTLKSGRTLLLE